MRYQVEDKTMKLVKVVLGVLFLSCVALGKDYREKKMPPYQVGTFVQLVHVDRGTVSQAGTTGILGQSNVRTTSLSYNAVLVDTPDGQYQIEPPVSIGAMMLDHTVDPHKAWFMDNLHPGDKVLFSAKCNKHNNCDIMVPNPDKPDKEIFTSGTFIPGGPAKTNPTFAVGSDFHLTFGFPAG
jgi:hypothetical protein